MKNGRLNDRERELWVLNDESLYRWYTSSRTKGGMRGFLRANRAELDAVINKALGNEPTTGGTHGRF